MSFRSVVKASVPKKLQDKAKPFGHLSESVLLNTLNNFPGRGLKVIGVTGTNGKTTTCYLIHKMMVESGYKVGLMTTVGYGVGNDIKPQIEHYTNVPVPELMRRLKQMKRAGIEWLVLETTSHALAQHRVWGIPYSVAVMTNVTHEHLDYHGTFENYLSAKRQLFRLTSRNKQGLGIGIVNADDPSAKLFVANIALSLTYGINAGEIRASNIKTTPSGSDFTVKSSAYKNQPLKIHVNLPGSFNVYNALAAASVGFALQMEPGQIEKGIAALKAVEGRMTTVDGGQDFSVVVDFAHTPDSFEKLFKDIKPAGDGKLIVMFGSAGRRDKAKRAKQGELAGIYCDEVIITEEDDRDEDGLQIMEAIAAGAKKAGKEHGKDLFLVHDRTEAIKFTLGKAQKGDTVLLLGKGHEKTIERADGEHPWDEITAARQILRVQLKR